MSLCFKTSDNKNFDHPPRMSDGRHFTDYRSNCLVNNILSSNNNNVSSHDFKNFLIKNANKLRSINRAYTSQKNSVTSLDNFNEVTEKYKFVCDKRTCKKVLVNPKGFGVSADYGINRNNRDNSVNNFAPNNICYNEQDNYKF